MGEFSPGELSRLSHRSFGTPGAERLVVLVGTGAGVANDPLPRETLAHDIRVLAVTLEGAAVARSGVYGSETPVEQTATLLAALIREMLEPAAPGNGPRGVRYEAVECRRAQTSADLSPDTSDRRTPHGTS